MNVTINKSNASKCFMLAQDFSKDKENLSKKAQEKYDSVQPPIGWLAEEKYDGYRARYHPEQQKFYSRSGANFPPKGDVPMWMLAAMPYVHLDGELYRGRGPEAFQKMGEIKRHNPSPQAWQGVKFVAYDLPEYDAPFSERKSELINIVKQCEEEWAKTLSEKDCPRWMKNMPCPIEISNHVIIKSRKQLDSMMKKIVSANGEGLMIKDPNAHYEARRSPHLLKMKVLYDDEAIITGYEKGQGKYKAMLGAFICSPLLPEVQGKRAIDTEYSFTMAGMNDTIRKDYKKTHPIGTIVTFLFNDRTASGKPRHPRYQRIRDDVVLNKKKSGNTELVLDILEKICKYERSQKGGAFKVKNYNKAIDSIKDKGDIDNFTLEQVLEMDGVGKSIASKTIQILESGSCDYYDSFKDKENHLELFTNVQGVGPVKAKELVVAGFKNIQELRENQELLNDKQKMGLKYYDDLLKRIPRTEGMKHEKLLMDTLAEVSGDKAKGLVSGSYRRGAKDSGDIDFLIKIPGDNKKIFKTFIDTLKERGYLVDHLAYGTTKYNGICKIGRTSSYRRVDIMFCKEEEFPFAVFYFTGSGEFNIEFRKLVATKGYSLNEHKISSKEHKITKKFKTELDIFDFFGVEWVNPSKRTAKAIKLV
jgi:DNA polymerase/3'-5' exonuclease PolX